MTAPEDPNRAQRELALDEVEESRRDLDTSKKRWVTAVLAARALKISNVQIASRSGVTETAIRLLVNRNEGRRR